jgi:hypothetical protein
MCECHNRPSEQVFPVAEMASRQHIEPVWNGHKHYLLSNYCPILLNSATQMLHLTDFLEHKEVVILKKVA